MAEVAWTSDGAWSDSPACTHPLTPTSVPSPPLLPLSCWFLGSTSKETCNSTPNLLLVPVSKGFCAFQRQVLGKKERRPWGWKFF